VPNTVKTTIVTGAASGIGRATAQRLAQAGHQLVLSDINADGLAAVAKQIKDEHGVAVVTVAGDVAQESTASAVTDAAQQHFGRIDALVNCAGIHHLGDIEEVSLEQWNQVMATNLTSMFLMCKYTIPHMPGASSIVNLGSVLGLTGHAEFATHAYAAAKGAILSMTRSIAVHCQSNRYNIRCNAIAPGAHETPMTVQAMQQVGGDSNGMDQIKSLGQGQPVDVANLVLFLASDESRNINGTQLVIDNCETIR